MLYSSKAVHNLSPRVSNMPRVASRVISEKGKQISENKGREILALKPYPTCRLSPEIVKIGQEAVKNPHCASSRGLQELRESITEKLREVTGCEINPEKEILITCGAMHALNMVIQSLLDPGDEIILFTPSYFFDGVIRLAGGQPVHVPLLKENKFKFNIELLEKNITGRTKAILINNPVNPTGYVANREELNRIAGLASRYGLLLISDESYDTLVYDQREHINYLEVEEARERIILIKSFTKSYALPEWRIGYLVAPPALVENFLKTLEWNTLYVNYISQKVAAAAMKYTERLKGATRKLQKNRDIFIKMIKKSNYFDIINPEGTPFLFIDVSHLKIGVEEVSTILLEKYGLPSTPGTYHFSPDHIRIPFGGKKEVISRAVTRMEEAFIDLNKNYM